MKPYWESNSGQIYQGDVLEVLRQLPDEFVHCVITSPPYWGLRDYGIEGQLGLEKTPEEYISKMVEIFQEVKRVLRGDGTLWLNLGDSYWGGKGKSSQAWSTENSDRDVIQGPQHQICGIGDTRPSDGKHDILKPKDLCGIPWRVALALQADGWYLRSDIIWHKPNPMPESVTDRPTKSHEYLFLMSKNPKYYYDTDAIKEPVAESTIGRGPVDFGGKKGREYTEPSDPNFRNGNEQWGRTFDYRSRLKNGRNKRSVWTIPTQPFPQAHFATFPMKLIEPCILAGTSEKGCCVECGSPWERVVEKGELINQTHDHKTNLGSTLGSKYLNRKEGSGWTVNSDFKAGHAFESKTIGWQPTCTCKPIAYSTPCTVLDPFFGSGTTGIVAYKHNRKFIGIDLSKTYLDEIAIPRIEKKCKQRKLF